MAPAALPAGCFLFFWRKGIGGTGVHGEVRCCGMPNVSCLNMGSLRALGRWPNHPACMKITGTHSGKFPMTGTFFHVLWRLEWSVTEASSHSTLIRFHGSQCLGAAKPLRTALPSLSTHFLTSAPCMVKMFPGSKLWYFSVVDLREAQRCRRETTRIIYLYKHKKKNLPEHAQAVL